MKTFLLLLSWDSVVSMSELFELSDWILDVTWIAYSASKDFEVAVATAHNVVLLFNSSSRRAEHFHSEVNCILYPS